MWEILKIFKLMTSKQFTPNFILPFYGKSEPNSLDVHEFKKEYKLILDSQIEFTNLLPEVSHI